MTVPPTLILQVGKRRLGDERLLVQGYMAKNSRDKIRLLPRFCKELGRDKGKWGPLPQTLQNR